MADERDKERRDSLRGDQDDRQDTIGIVLVTEVKRIEEAELRVELERHEQAVIEALIANEERLSEAQRHVDRMLEEAFVLPDGRRVFKTEDGLRVFDEHGQEVGSDEITPDAVEDRRPRWERVVEAKSAVLGLTQEREELLDYQTKLDDANEKMAAGTISDDELADLDRLMSDDVPAAVRHRLSTDNDEPCSAVEALPPDGPADFGLWPVAGADFEFQ